MKGKIFHNTEQDSYILSLGFFSWAAQAAKLDRVTRAGTVSRVNGVSFTHAKHMPQNISEPHALPNALGCLTKIEGLKQVLILFFGLKDSDESVFLQISGLCRGLLRFHQRHQDKMGVQFQPGRQHLARSAVSCPAAVLQPERQHRGYSHADRGRRRLAGA